jgi:hypothetical protein
VKVVILAATASQEFHLTTFPHGTLTLGTVFTVIDNAAGTPIAGTFSNLADGSTITRGRNTSRAIYEGGDGNDLIRTVVP